MPSEPTLERVHLLAPPGVHIDLNAMAQHAAPRLDTWPLALATRLRRGGGIIGENVPPDVADALREAWSMQSSAPLLTTPADGLLPRAYLRRVTRVGFVEGGYRFGFLREPDETVALDEFACAFITVWGDEPDDPAPVAATSESLRSLVETVAAEREGSARAVLGDKQARIHSTTLSLARAEPVEFYQVEVGAVFPDLATAERTSSLDVWLAFVERVFGDLDAARFLPETLAFWSEPALDPVLVSDRQELHHRYSWIAEILAHQLWEPFR